MRRLGLALLVTGVGCGFTPLTNKVQVGEEAFVIVVGEGRDGAVDLFAAPAEGGKFYQLTYNLVAESKPTLAPSGTRVAFLRESPGGGGLDLILQNLLNGTETPHRLPPEAGAVVRLGFGSTDDSLVVAADHGLYLVTDGGIEAVSALPALRLDSLTYQRLGEVGFASLRTCRAGSGWCLVRGSDQETALPTDATDPIRWGSDGMAYLRNGHLEVRPLGGGRIRQPTWPNQPPKLRQPTQHPGSRRP